MSETTPAKRKPGRPKGCKKTGGRAKGTPNRDRSATIERIQREADPIGFLCKVCRGVRMEAAAEDNAKKKTHWFPSGDQRLHAAQVLARKCMPDMKSIEHAGPLGEPLSVRINLGP